MQKSGNKLACIDRQQDIVLVSATLRFTVWSIISDMRGKTTTSYVVLHYFSTRMETIFQVPDTISRDWWALIRNLNCIEPKAGSGCSFEGVHSSCYKSYKCSIFVYYSLLQVKYQRSDLLKHELVSTFLRHKFTRFGAAFYLVDFLLYAFFLTFLTLYALFVPTPLDDICELI